MSAPLLRLAIHTRGKADARAVSTGKPSVDLDGACRYRKVILPLQARLGLEHIVP